MELNRKGKQGNHNFVKEVFSRIEIKKVIKNELFFTT